MKKKLNLSKVAAIALAACISCGNLSINVQAQEGYLDEKLADWMELAGESDVVEILIELNDDVPAMAQVQPQVERELEEGKLSFDDRTSRLAELYLEVKQQILDEFLEANPQLAEKIIKEVAAVPGIVLMADKEEIQQYKTLEGVETILGNTLLNAEDENNNSNVWSWDCVWFGDYPQKEVKNSALLADASYDENGYTVIMGNTYKRESRDGQYYYFKCEPIKWRILEDNGEELFLLADKSIDYRRYVNIDAGDGWVRSDIHTWLNDTFYNTAFADEKTYIVTKTIQDDLIGEAEDKVILLSKEEASNTAYGFPTGMTQRSSARQCENTDYAKFCSYDEQEVTKLSGKWMLRDTDSVCSGEDGIRFVASVDMHGIYMPKFGIRPAIYVKKDMMNTVGFDAGTVGEDGTIKEKDAPVSSAVQLADAQNLLKCALKITPVLEGDVIVLDMDGDANITLSDAMNVLKRSLKIIE